MKNEKRKIKENKKKHNNFKKKPKKEDSKGYLPRRLKKVIFCKNVTRNRAAIEAKKNLDLKVALRPSGVLLVSLKSVDRNSSTSMSARHGCPDEQCDTSLFPDTVHRAFEFNHFVVDEEDRAGESTLAESSGAEIPRTSRRREPR